MPFEHIAGPVATLQLPSEPQFTSYKIERPIFPTAEIVQQSVNSINDIIKQMSPQARMERELQMEKTRSQLQLYRDYRANPKDYEMDARGNIRHIDPATYYERMGKAYNALNARHRYIRGQDTENRANAFIDNWKARGNAADTQDSQQNNPDRPPVPQPWRPKQLPAFKEPNLQMELPPRASTDTTTPQEPFGPDQTMMAGEPPPDEEMFT